MRKSVADVFTLTSSFIDPKRLIFVAPCHPMTAAKKLMRLFHLYQKKGFSMFLDTYYHYTPATIPVASTSDFAFVTRALADPYHHLSYRLIADTKKVDGTWIASIANYGQQIETRAARIHRNMLQRCKDGGNLQYRQPSYVGCSVSENFRDFQYFCQWAQHQIGYGIEGWQLDKDILIPGNRHYSESTCCFVPREINNLFTSHSVSRKLLPTGVYQSGSKFQARFSSRDGKLITLGSYETPQQAHIAYRGHKLDLVRSSAEKFQDVIEPSVYEALLNCASRCNFQIH